MKPAWIFTCLTCLCCLLNPQQTHAQLYVAGTYPASPQTTDSVYFVTVYLSSYHPVFNVQHTTTLSNDTIHRYVNFCLDTYYNFSGNAADTLVIGQLPAGNYTIHFSYDVTRTLTACAAEGEFHETFVHFQVVENTTGVQNEEIPTVVYYPNPVYDRFQTSPEQYSQGLEIYTATGEYKQTLWPVNGYYDMREFAPGLYFIKPTHDKNIRWQRVIKV